MNAALDTLCYIQEQTSFTDDYANDFGYEVHKIHGDRFYVTFPAILQSFGNINRNGREYDADNIWSCISTDDYIQSQLRCNSWVGERDHPAPELVGQELTLQRISNPSLANASHFIRSPHLSDDKKYLHANIQTYIGTEAGESMAENIVYSHVVPCFSARVLGALQRKGNRPVVNVRKLITYDSVLFPSHSDAMGQLKQPLMEAANVLATAAACKLIMLPELAKMAMNNDDGAKWLCESFQLTEKDLLGVTESGNSMVISENATNVYIQPITDSKIRSKTKSMIQDWLHQ